MIDTHAHLYDEAFDEDRDEVMARAKAAGLTKIVLPNIDSDSLPRMLRLEEEYPDYCYAAIGLHPTSVKENFEEELALVKSELERRRYIAVGEIGIDLYWDKSFLSEQVLAFQKQVEWALDYDLPIIIHMRESFRETMDALAPYKDKGLRGVFHSFTGTAQEAKEILAYKGFYIGINGVLTFKNSKLGESLAEIGVEHLLLETDAPYLTPMPFRGKRNESSYLPYIAEKIALHCGLSREKVSEQTTKNAKKLYNF